MLSASRLLTGRIEQSDVLRYGRASSALPSHLLHYSSDKKPVVVWTATRRCNLHCAHCYTDSRDRPYPEELSTAEALAMVDDLAAFGSPVLLISGGEPLRRPDVIDVARHATQQGMRVVLSTNGTLLTLKTADALAAAGVSYVGISIDGPPTMHDRFRGMRGAFNDAMRGVIAAQVAGLKVGFRFTLTKQNLRQLGWLMRLMVDVDVRRLCVYHLAPTGRGARIQHFTPSHAETRQALDFLFDRVESLAARGFDAEVLTADNHADAAYLWQRIAERQPERADAVWRLLEWNGGNRSGEAIAAVDADGTVYPDQFWRWQPLGNLRERSFRTIWEGEPPPLLRALRARTERLPAQCQDCRFLSLCNGNFRSRAEATSDDLWGLDPLCYLREDERRAS